MMRGEGGGTLQANGSSFFGGLFMGEGVRERVSRGALARVTGEVGGMGYEKTRCAVSIGGEGHSMRAGLGGGRS